jgi:hypothetical protein
MSDGQIPFYAGPGGFLLVRDMDLVMTPGVSFGNASLVAHGFMPPLTGDGTQFLNGDGAWVTMTTGGTAAGSWVPLSLGVEQDYSDYLVVDTPPWPTPLVFVSDGTGQAILVAYE